MEKLAALKRAQRSGRDLLAAPRTVEQWLTEWLDEVKAKGGTRPTTVERYRQVTRLYLVPDAGPGPVGAAGAGRRARLLNSLGERLALAPAHKVQGVLRAALSDAVRLDLVERNVAKLARPPSLVADERRALTVAEAQHLLNAAGERFEALFTVALTMGLRRGELLGLRWPDLTEDGRVLRVERAVQRVADQVLVGAPKTPAVQTHLAGPGDGAGSVRPAACSASQGAVGGRRGLAGRGLRLLVDDRLGSGPEERDPRVRAAALSRRTPVASLARPAARVGDLLAGPRGRGAHGDGDPRSLDDPARDGRVRARPSRSGGTPRRRRWTAR